MKGSSCRVCKKWCSECCKAVAARLRSCSHVNAPRPLSPPQQGSSWTPISMAASLMRSVSGIIIGAVTFRSHLGIVIVPSL